MKKSLLTAVAAGLTLSACATGPIYKPAASPNATGYTEQIIEDDRVQVSFKGSSTTPREEVESFLIHRAAEITLEKGYDYFSVVERDSDKIVRQVGGSPHLFHSRYGFGYSYYHPRFGWYGAYDPFWTGSHVSQITRYKAYAEILLRKGEKPADDTKAYDAKEVIANLSELIAEDAADQ
jgi:hypothetical protein